MRIIGTSLFCFMDGQTLLQTVNLHHANLNGGDSRKGNQKKFCQARNTSKLIDELPIVEITKLIKD
jgi:hypothetical protein